MARGTNSASKYDCKTIYGAFTVLIGLFMLIAPFYRGLFFRINYLPAIIVVSIIFAAYMAYRLIDKGSDIPGTYMDVLVILIPIVYLISFFFAVNAKDGFDAFLLYCSYFMLYKLTSELSIKNERFKNIFINIIIASAFILSLTSMLHLAGILNLKGEFSGKRLSGLYQYANTTASVLGVGIILSLNKLISERNIKLKVLYQIVLTALLPSFISTLSRGGYLVLAAVLLLNFILVGARAKVRLLLGLSISFLASVFYIYKYYTLPETAFTTVWVHYLVSILASAALICIVHFIQSRVSFKFSDKAINRALIVMTLLVLGAAVLLFTVKVPIEYSIEHSTSEQASWKGEAILINELKPDSRNTVEFDVKASIESQHSYGVIIVSYNKANEGKQLLDVSESTGPEFTRKSLEFKTLGDTDRIVINLYNYETGSYTVYKNVAIKDSNGSVVKKIDKLKYIPKDIADRISDINLKTENASLRIYFAKDGLKIIKDYPLVGAGGGAWRNLYRHYQSVPYNTSEVHNFYVQYGTEVGIIGLVILTGLLISLVISMIRSVRNNSKYIYVYLAAILLLLHSCIDFNLSLASVAYILWMLIGLINSDKNTPLIEKLSKRYAAAALVLSLTVCIFASSMFYGMKLGTRGAITFQEKSDTNKAIDLYNKATDFDRYNGLYRIDLVQLLNNKLKKTKDSKDLNAVLEQISYARKYEPHNHQFTSTICNILLSLGKFEEASKLADEKVSDEPLLEQSYMTKIDVNFQITSYYARENRMKEAVPYMEKVMEAKNEIEKINSKLQVPLKLEGDYLKKFEAVEQALKQ